MHILDVVKYEGPNNVLVWKHPAEDFNTASQLIVHETQEALFFRDGQALDLFPAGRFTLHTQNIPLLSRLVKIPFDGVSPFHCEVYYINKAEQMAIRWGTDSRVQYTDPALGYQLTIGASGEMTIAVEDSRKLVLKLVGTEAALGQQKFISYMRSIINQIVKPYLARVMGEGTFSIFDVDAHMEEFASVLHARLRGDFADYGIELRRFMITNIAKPEDDPNYQYELSLNAQQRQRIRQAQIDLQEQQIRQIGQANLDAQQTVISAEARAEQRRREGYTYQEERGFDVSERVASNAAVGEFSNIGIGMGMISGVGGALSGGVAQMTTDAMQSAVGGGFGGPGADAAAAGIAGAAIGAAAAGAVGGQDAGTGASPGAATAGAGAASQDPGADDGLDGFKTRIAKLKILHDEGIIDDAEFEAQKARILSEI